MGKGIVNFLGAIAGKEISKELINEFQDEFDEVIQALKDNKSLKNVPNLELEEFDISVSPQGESEKVFKTKIEHKNVRAIFALSDTPTREIDFIISIDRKVIISDSYMPVQVIQKNSFQSAIECSWLVNKEIDTSDVLIKLKDLGTAGTADFNVKFYFICEK